MRWLSYYGARLVGLLGELASVRAHVVEYKLVLLRRLTQPLLVRLGAWA